MEAVRIAFFSVHVSKPTTITIRTLGKIDGDELSTLVAQFGMRTNKTEIVAVLEAYDANGDGELDLEEFLNMMATIYFRDKQRIKVTPLEIEEEKWTCQFHLMGNENQISKKPMISLLVDIYLYFLLLH